MHVINLTAHGYHLLVLESPPKVTLRTSALDNNWLCIVEIFIMPPLSLHESLTICHRVLNQHVFPFEISYVVEQRKSLYSSSRNLSIQSLAFHGKGRRMREVQKHTSVASAHVRTSWVINRLKNNSAPLLSGRQVIPGDGVSEHNTATATQMCLVSLSYAKLCFVHGHLVYVLTFSTLSLPLLVRA